MSPGETKTVTIPPEEAYDQPNPGMVHEVPRSDIPDNISLHEGAQLAASDGQGNQMQLTVVATTEDTVTLDANHALAGKALTFELTLDSIAS